MNYIKEKTFMRKVMWPFDGGQPSSHGTPRNWRRLKKPCDMKKILVPCDFSKPAIEALRFAVMLAKKTGGRIFVLKAIDTPISYESAFGVQPYTFDPGLRKEFSDQAKKRFASLKSGIERSMQNRLSFHVEFGGVTPTIRDFIREKKIDLVLMGTRGSSGIQEFFVGSNTEKIVRLSPVPVLSVHKAPRSLTSIKSIVVPGTLEPGHERLVHLAKAVQQLFKATLHLVFVNTPGVFLTSAEVSRAFRDFVKKFRVKRYTTNTWNDITVQDGIRSFARERDADMVIMSTHGHRGLAHLVSGSIAEDTVNHIECPVLTYTEKG